MSTGEIAAQQNTSVELLQPQPTRRGWWLSAGIGALLTALAVFLLPTPPQTSADATGDPALAADLRTATEGLDAQGFAVATGSATGVVRSAAIGQADTRDDRPMTAQTPQEIGSVTKSMTGLLFADAVDRGEVTPTTTLGEVFADAGLPADVGAITLEQLATHTSGLPSLGDGRTVRAVLTNYTHGNPYADQSVDDTLADAAGTRRLDEPGEYSYSNLGFSLLGHALAERAGTTWSALLAERLLDPLGMSDTVDGVVPDGAAHETAANGAPTEPWISEGTGPAGAGVWSTADDLGRLLAAVTAGSAPGLEALTPSSDTDQDTMRSGWGWFTVERDGRTVLLNNGATAGGVSSILLDPEQGSWYAVTAPSSTETQTVTMRLAGFEVATPSARESWTSIPVLVTVVLLLFAVASPVATALQRRVRRPGQRLDRLRVLDSQVLPVVVLLLGLHSIGAWNVVPPLVWLVAVFLGSTACASLLVRWPQLTWPQTQRAARYTGAAISSAVFLAVLVLLLA